MKGSCVLILILSLGLRVRFLAGYNLDTEQPISFSGPTGSMFGYSVLLHTNSHNTWLLVGAPVDNSSSSTVRSPGAVYQCSISSSKQPACQQIQTGMGSCGKTCKPESEDQWLGVSLSRDPVNGDILACGHRWKNVFYSQKDVQNNKLPHGVCYRYSSDLSQPGQAMIPCYRDHQKKFGDLYGSCQAGMSTFLTEELVIMGAPGTSYWTGSVLVYNTSSRTMAAYLDEGTGQVQFGSYLGYSVGAGHFLHPGSTEVVGGAPQHSQTGKAYVFQVEGSLLKIVSELSGDKLGSYFGASVCSVDLNADGLSDLLVGAPLTSSSTPTGVAREEGRVHVYINHGEARLIEADFQLQGRDSYAARFGQTMINLGDLDDDGYHDVAIGAPQEEDLKGAVYIYNGGKDGISERYSQRISGQVLGRDLSMFGESLSSGVDIDDNGYQDVAIGAFLSDAAVVLRTRPVLKVEASLLLPDRLNRSVAACQDHPGAGLKGDQGVAGLASRVCANVTVCFRASARQYRGYIDIHYNLTADVLHKASFPHRFYFHGNGSSSGTTGRVRTRLNQLTCAQHLTYLRREVRDIYTPVQFEASYWLRQPSVSRSSSRSLRSLKPILQQRPGSTHTVTNQTKFSRFCLEVNCSTNLQLSAQLVLPQNLSYFALGNGRSILLKTTLANSGDDSFLPRLSLRFPTHIHYIKVLQNEVSCDVSEGGVDCSISSLSLPAHTELNINFLLDVNQSSSAGDVSISVNASSDNYEMEEYLDDNTVSLLLPLRYGVDVNVHGFVSPTSFVFGDEQSTPVDCYSESFNFTYKVLNLGPSRSVDSVLEIELPKSLSPYSYRLLQLTDWQSSQGQCHLSNQTATVEEECDLPDVSVLKQIVFYFSKTTTRRMFCGRQDILCERLVCYLGNLESGKEATVQITTKLNPTVLLQYPGRHGIMVVESIAVVTSPTEDEHTIVTHTLPLAQVVVEAHFNQKPPAAVQIFIIIVSLIIGLLILTALIYCLWKAGFFKRQHQKTDDDFKRESWDYVPKMDKTESSS